MQYQVIRTSLIIKLLHLESEKKYIGFSNTSRVDSLYRFIRSVVDKVKTDICILEKNYHLSQKVSNASKIIDPVINRFSKNDESSHLNICDH